MNKAINQISHREIMKSAGLSMCAVASLFGAPGVQASDVTPNIRIDTGGKP